MRKPLNIKLRANDKVVSTQLLGRSMPVGVSFLVFTEMGFVYRLDYAGHIAKYSQLWVDQNGD